MNSGETSPSDFDFDSYLTAWDAAPSRKVRRHYGKISCQKKEKRKALREERRLRRTESDPVVFEEISLTSSCDESSSVISRLHDDRPVLPPRSRLLVRSKSATAESDSSLHQKMARHHSFTLCSRPPLRHVSSSSLVSECAHEPENLDPNVSDHFLNGSTFDSPSAPAGKLQPPLSTMDEHPKARPRKIRALSDLGDLQRSFSDLAREADAVQCWDDATPKKHTSIAFDLADSDSASVLGSASTINSRKRCVRDSLGCDDFQCDTSSQCGGAVRSSKSRSRIYSSEFAPMLESIRSLNEGQPKKLQRRLQHCVDSDDGGDNDSDDGTPFLDKSFEIEDFTNSDFIQASVSRHPRTFRSMSCDNFEEVIFGATSALGTRVLTNENIVQSMPSIEDLQFMIKGLRKSKRGAVAMFGMASTWTVSLPSQWPSDRRARVLEWSTQELGLSMRTGGPAVVFLNVAASKAQTLLDHLEAALLFYQDQNPIPGDSIPQHGGTSDNIVRQGSPASNHSQTLQPRGFRESSATDSNDNDLVAALSGISLADSESSLLNASGEARKFVRTVTLDPNSDVTHNSEPRHSSEHVMGGNELVSHMHASSPRKCRGRRSSSSRTSTGRRPRLLVDTELRANIVSSPFVTSSKPICECHSFEILETPHTTRRAYWERPKNGRDWGASDRCPFEVISELSARFEQALRTDGQHSEDSSISVFDSILAPITTGIRHGMDDVDEESESETGLMFEGQDTLDDHSLSPFEQPCDELRRSSVGAGAFAGLHLNEFHGNDDDEDRTIRRKLESMAKLKRVSLCATGLQVRKSIGHSRSSYFSNLPRLSTLPSTLTLNDSDRFSFVPLRSSQPQENNYPTGQGSILFDSKILAMIFSFLNEEDLLCRSTPVCTTWADASTYAHTTLMLLSVGCADVEDDLIETGEETICSLSLMTSMQRSWRYLMNQFPHACFLAGGAFKNVYKVFNISTQSYEALSVMDIEVIESTGNKRVVGAELAVSAMLSSLVRRNVCPNFVVTRRVFTCSYEPPKLFWGSEENKQPRGGLYSPRLCDGKKPREPSVKHRSRFQYIRMELCSEGDAEQFLKSQPEQSISPLQARNLIFQIAFALHAAADRFSLKHYDIKLLNIFLQKMSGVNTDFLTLKYGLGSHVFVLQMPTASALIAKVADYGTANVQAESNGQPATIAQFTTLENTPPEFMILGDLATQGHGHDAFGLGLCMLHLFTGHAPYEEILADVMCPSGLKAKLQSVWEDENSSGYSVIRSVILADVYKDEAGNIVEGEADDTLYDTLYRYLVLFGIPESKFKMKVCGKVWRAISSSFEGDVNGRSYGRSARNKSGSDLAQFKNDQRKYSLRHGDNVFISRAREKLEQVPGGLDLLLSLVDFDPEKRATVRDVLNSQFMIPLREDHNDVRNCEEKPSNHVMSFMAYATA